MATREKTKSKDRFTPRQGQFLAFIHLYWKLHRQAPAELDLLRYFGLTPPAVHDMISGCINSA
jgi:repressor LexA